MKLVVQRVKRASVDIEGKRVSAINQGLLILLGITHTDTKELIEKAVEKIEKLRIFPDELGKTNLSIKDINGEILVVSQFTLYGDTKKGNRPSFIEAATQDVAIELYNYFLEYAKPRFKKVGSGEFGATMDVSLVNDGPFTIIMDIFP